MSCSPIRAFLTIASVTLGICLFSAGVPRTVLGEPASASAEEKIPQLIKQLDSVSFHAREQAHQTLVKLPGTLAPRLEQIRNSATSPEIRGRLKQIVKQRCRASWQGDLPSALTSAGRDDKLVVVFSTHGAADGYSCMGANLMRRVTFANEQMVQDLRKQAVTVWHDQNGALVNGKGFAINCRQQPVQPPPTDAMIKAYPVGGGGGNLRTYFCAPSGKIVHYLEGYWPVKQFAAEVRYAQVQYQAMKNSSADAVPKTLAEKLSKEIAEIEKLRKKLTKLHPEEFKKPFPKSEIRRLHASLGLKIKAYRDGAKLAGKDISPVLAKLMAKQIDFGVKI